MQFGDEDAAPGEPQSRPPRSDEADAPRSDATPLPSDGLFSSLPLALGATVLVAALIGLAFRPSIAATPTFWALVTAPNLLAAAWSVYYLHREDLLFERLRPRGGDISLGVFVGVGLLVASWAGRTTLATVGTPQQAWLLSVYVQVGDPEIVQGSLLLTSLLLLVVVAEELFWRGWVLDVCTRRIGHRRGWMLATLLYAATMVPTVFTLAAAEAGPNPLLLVAALFCGLVWTFMAHVIGRLPPVILAHAVFTYFSVVQFRLPGT